MEKILELKNITKKFHDVIANDQVCLEIEKGETHAILGENGAGKSTLMNILYGVLKPDSGKIIFDGKEVTIHNPQDARRLGIGMVHQHFMLIPALTVLENILLTTCQSTFVNVKQTRARIQELSDKFGLEVDPSALVKDLSVGQQQRVEILKALYRSCKLLILDEPTAVLTPQESKGLFAIIHQLNAAGTAVVFISHKLNEIMDICDRVTVLRRGKTVWSTEIKNTNELELAKQMVGKDIKFTINTQSKCSDEKVLEVKNLYVSTKYKKNLIQDLSFTIHKSEIYGIAGVDGNGQSELVKAILSIIPKDSGQVLLLGKDITNVNTQNIFSQNIGHIPEDRLQMGVISQFPLYENTSFYNYNKNPFSYNYFIDWRKESIYSKSLIEKYNIVASNDRVSLSTLSGGNQQKMVVARELDKCPPLLIAAHPTRGVDIGASEAIHQQIIQQRDNGCAVLLISTELEEILSLSDRIGVIYEGKIIQETDRENATSEQLGLWMAGKKTSTK